MTIDALRALGLAVPGTHVTIRPKDKRHGMTAPPDAAPRLPTTMVCRTAARTVAVAPDRGLG